MNEITSTEIPLPVSFAREIRGTNLLVYNLISECLKNKVVLDDKVLQDWWLEKIVKPKKKYTQGRYLGKNNLGQNVWERILEYDYYMRKIAEKGKLSYYSMADAKQKIKYSIGSLVMRGYLRVLPVINISEPAKQKQLEENN